MLRKYSIPVPAEIDYKKLSTGIDLREEMMKCGEITEDPNGTFILPELLNEMPPEAKALYHRIDRLDDRCDAWNNRRNFIAFMQHQSSKRSELHGLYLISLDDELLAVFFEAYKASGNGQKRELILTLRDFAYDFTSISSVEDIQLTITNFNKLGTMLKGLLESEQDAITRLIIIPARLYICHKHLSFHGYRLTAIISREPVCGKCTVQSALVTQRRNTSQEIR